MLQLGTRVHPLIQEFLVEEETLAAMLRTVGAPLNLIFPQVMTENIQHFRAVFATAGVSYQIYYAHKVNQATGFVRQALHNKVRIDVASINELRHALAQGFHPEKIEVTGPKNRELLTLALHLRVLLSVDNFWELQQIIDLMQALDLSEPQPLLLRVTGFDDLAYGVRSKPSKFGIPLAEMASVLNLLQSEPHRLELLGFAFHLDTNEEKEKLVAFENCLALFEEAYARGLQPSVINIGGGFRQAFIDDEQTWRTYERALRESLTGKTPSLAWPGIHFGYRIESGQVRGIPVFHKYANTTPGHDFLRTFLHSPLPNQQDRSVAEVLRDNAIELYLEPGKALVDHAGITVDTVNFVKRLANDEIIISLNMKRDDLVAADQEVMLDPVILYQGEAATYPKGEFGVYISGNLCLERDLIYNHKTFLERLPQEGDIVAFVNTAGYQMDLSASQGLMKARNKKLVVIKKNEKFYWFDEDAFAPHAVESSRAGQPYP